MGFFFFFCGGGLCYESVEYKRRMQHLTVKYRAEGSSKEKMQHGNNEMFLLLSEPTSILMDPWVQTWAAGVVLDDLVVRLVEF